MEYILETAEFDEVAKAASIDYGKIDTVLKLAQLNSAILTNIGQECNLASIEIELLAKVSNWI